MIAATISSNPLKPQENFSKVGILVAGLPKMRTTPIVQELGQLKEGSHYYVCYIRQVLARTHL
jgi:hypothetical protein